MQEYVVAGHIESIVKCLKWVWGGIHVETCLNWFSASRHCQGFRFLTASSEGGVGPNLEETFIKFSVKRTHLYVKLS